MFRASRSAHWISHPEVGPSTCRVSSALRGEPWPFSEEDAFRGLSCGSLPGDVYCETMICPECGRDGAASAFVGQGPFERAVRHEECPSGHAWHVKEGFGTESGPIECSCPDDWLTVPAGFGMRFSGLEHDAEMDAFRWRLGGRIVRRTGDAVVLDVRVVEDAGGTRTMAVVGGQYEIGAEKVIEIRSRRRH